VFLANLAMLLLEIDNLLDEQVAIFFLTRKLDLKMLLLLLKSAMLAIKLLSHVSHKLELLIERLLSEQWVLIVLLLPHRVIKEVLAPLSQPLVAHLPELLLTI